MPKELSLVFQWKQLSDAWGLYSPVKRGVATIELHHRMSSDKNRLDTYFHELTHFIIDIENRNLRAQGKRPTKLHGSIEEKICRAVAKAATEAFIQGHKQEKLRKRKLK